MTTRVSWHLLKDARIPIFGTLTLNVSPGGNDSTGGILSPFATPQAAMDYAAANIDFRHGGVGNLVLDIDAGQYGELDIRALPPGICSIFVIGRGDNASTLSNVVSHAPCEVMLSNIGFNGGDPLSGFSVAAYHASTIIVGGNVSFSPSATKELTPIVALNGGEISIDNATIKIRNGAAYSCIIRADKGGVVFVSSGTQFVFDVDVFASGYFAYAYNGGRIISPSIAASGQVNCSKYAAATCGQIITGGNINGIPGTVGGICDASSVVC